MKTIFGPHTQRVSEVISSLRDLSPADVDLVAVAWKHASDLERAEAWAQVHRLTSAEERYPILAAAAAARRTAMHTARSLHRTDWAFWAAAWDAAAAIAAADRIGRCYDVLTAPVAAVMPALAQGRDDAQGQDEAQGRDEAQGQARVPSPRSQQEAALPRGRSS